MVRKIISIVLHSLSALYAAILYVLAPSICYACREFLVNQAILCSDCEGRLLPIAPKLIQINKDCNLTVHAISRYDDPLKRLILAKHSSDHSPFYALADLMWQKTVLPYIAIDYFVPIPLHWTRKMKRGFNQAEILAKRLGQHGNIAVLDMISRIKKTEYQARVQRELRKDNVVNVFSIKKDIHIKGKHIMLVDDLCTTGSTAVAVAKLLLKYKPASISLVVACRAL